MKSSFCKYSHFFKAALLSVIFAVHLSVKAETLLVGCGEKYEKPSQAARVAKDGDTILIKKGVYIDVFHDDFDWGRRRVSRYGF